MHTHYIFLSLDSGATLRPSLSLSLAHPAAAPFHSRFLSPVPDVHLYITAFLFQPSPPVHLHTCTLFRAARFPINYISLFPARLISATLSPSIILIYPLSRCLPPCHRLAPPFPGLFLHLLLLLLVFSPRLSLIPSSILRHSCIQPLPARSLTDRLDFAAAGPSCRRFSQTGWTRLIDACIGDLDSRFSKDAS